VLEKDFNVQRSSENSNAIKIEVVPAGRSGDRNRVDAPCDPCHHGDGYTGSHRKINITKAMASECPCIFTRKP
jgi:hypothetical protein